MRIVVLWVFYMTFLFCFSIIKGRFIFVKDNRNKFVFYGIEIE